MPADPRPAVTPPTIGISSSAGDLSCASGLRSVRPIVLFGQPIPDRARETGMPERTLRRRVAQFDTFGMRSLFADLTDPQPDRRRLPPAIRQAIHASSEDGVHRAVALVAADEADPIGIRCCPSSRVHRTSPEAA